MQISTGKAPKNWAFCRLWKECGKLGLSQKLDKAKRPPWRKNELPDKLKFETL